MTQSRNNSGSIYIYNIIYGLKILYNIYIWSENQTGKDIKKCLLTHREDLERRWEVLFQPLSAYVNWSTSNLEFGVHVGATNSEF